MNRIYHPFWVIVNKEVSDHVRSWRFIIMIVLIALTCMGSLYTALTNIGDSIKPNDPDNAFLFLKLFTVSDGTLPSFVVFISFLGPLLGIALGFDAINSEQNRGTLSRILSQPIDCYWHYVVLPGSSGDGIRIDSDRYSSDGGRVFADGVFYHCQHLLCCFLAEPVDILFH